MPTQTANKKDAGKPMLEYLPGSFLQRTSKAYSQLISMLFDRGWDNPYTEGSLRVLEEGVRCSIDIIAEVLVSVGLDPIQVCLAARMNGVEKYAPYDFSLPMDWCRWVGAIRRHIAIGQHSWISKKEDLKIDPSSGVYHVGHALCTLTFLYDCLIYNRPFDGRLQSLHEKQERNHDEESATP